MGRGSDHNRAITIGDKGGAGLGVDIAYWENRYIVVDLAEPIFKFGKYKGKSLAEAPPSYLRWMLKELELTNAEKGKVNKQLRSS